MKPFRFNLQVVRTLRQRKEQQAMEGYALALREQRKAVDQWQQVQAELEAAWSEWTTAMAEACPAAAVAQMQHYFQRVEVRRQQCVEQVRDSERAVQAALQGMLEARRDREAVDIYFDLQHLEYDRALQREERKVLDELAQRRTGAILSWSPTESVAHE
jgi:flagellar export protein FliJ